MRHHAKAPSADSISGIGDSVIGRGFATDGVSRRVKGSSAHLSDSGSRLLCAALAFVLVVAAWLAIASAPALAVNERVFVERFGPDGTSATAFSQPFQMAFNQSTKRLYLLDTNASAKKLYAFNMSISGHPVAEGSPFPISTTQISTADGLAVDNTNLTSAGNIYFMSNTASDRKLYGFNSAGIPLGGNFPITLSPSSDSYNGAAVDGSGNIWISDKTNKKVREYSSAGVELTGAGHEISTAALGENPRWIAFDLANNAYINFLSGGLTYRCTALSGYAACSLFSSSSIPTKGLAVDTATGNVFTTRESNPRKSIEEFASTGEPAIYKFGDESLKSIPACSTSNQVYNGIVTNNTTGELYVAEQACLKQIVVFSSYGELPTVVVNSAAGLTGTHANLSGTVDPGGAGITECQFEYGTNANFTGAYSTPCEYEYEAGKFTTNPSKIPIDSTAHRVTASLSGLKPQSTTYYVRLVVKNAIGPKTAENNFTTPETFVTNSASTVTATGGTMNAAVDPDGVALTECKFEYGVTTSYGLSKPCTPLAGAIPNDSNSHVVSSALTGLTPNRVYNYRISVSSLLGTFTGADQAFETLGPPEVLEQAVLRVGGTTASLYVKVDPRGTATTYYFEYGSTMAYGKRAPVEFDLSAGSGPEPAKNQVNLTGLQPNTTYYFRIVAVNGAGTTESPDQIFRTASAACPNEAIRQEQGAEATELPACMAVEMVSPPQKFGQSAGVPEVSADGERVRFNSLAALAETRSLNTALYGEVYVASRGVSGWSVAPTAPPGWVIGGWDSGANFARGFSPELTSWFQLVTTKEENRWARGEGQVYRGGIDGSFESMSPLLSPIDGGSHGEQNVISSEFEGASTDQSHFYFHMGEMSATYLPGDPSPTGAGAAPNIYIAHRDGRGTASFELLARDSAGKVWGGNCGARIGGNEGSNNSATGRNQGAVSEDGSRVYFSTRPGQPTNSTPGGPISGNCEPASYRLRIMQRLEKAGGPEITELIEDECARTSPEPVCKSEAELNGSDFYQGASVDQTKVYFTTNRQLVSSDLDGSATECSNYSGVPGCDLYLYDASKLAGHRLTQVSAGENVPGEHEVGKEADVYNGTVAISGEGSHAYFTAAGVLTAHPNPAGTYPESGKPNLYLYDAETGSISFVGTLSSADSGGLWGGAGTFKNNAYPVPATGRNGSGEEVGGNGHVLLFQTHASLTADDTDGGHLDVYRYNAGAGPAALECLSCRPGGPDNQSFDVIEHRDVEPALVGSDFAEFGRWTSEDGETVVFRTAEPLTAGDTSGAVDAYMWRDGQLSRLLGTSDLSHAPLGPQPPKSTDGPVLSPDGSTVAFRAFVPLLPQDGDTASDIYVARVDGGFPNDASSESCSGEACQGAPSSAPAFMAPGSTTFSGAGSLVQQLATPKPKVKVAVPAKPGKLAKALKACRTKRSRSKRVACEKTALIRYAPGRKVARKASQKNEPAASREVGK